MNCRRKAKMTLVEILVALALISLISGVIAINVRFAYLQQLFRTEVEAVVDNLRLAQEMMLWAGFDVHLFFRPAADGTGMLTGIRVEEELPKRWRQILKKREFKLSEVHIVSFSEDPSAPEIDIRFLSGGSLMSRGTLYLSTHLDPAAPNALSRMICLSGWPQPIIAEPFDKRAFCESPPTDLRLTNLTVQEIGEVENGRN